MAEAVLVVEDKLELMESFLRARMVQQQADSSESPRSVRKMERSESQRFLLDDMLATQQRRGALGRCFWISFKGVKPPEL